MLPISSRIVSSASLGYAQRSPSVTDISVGVGEPIVTITGVSDQGAS